MLNEEKIILLDLITNVKLEGMYVVLTIPDTEKQFLEYIPPAYIKLDIQKFGDLVFYDWLIDPNFPIEFDSVKYKAKDLIAGRIVTEVNKTYWTRNDFEKACEHCNANNVINNY